MLERAFIAAGLVAMLGTLTACGKHGPAPHIVTIALVGAVPGSGYEGFAAQALAGLTACHRQTNASIVVETPTSPSDLESDLILMATENKSAIFAVGYPAAAPLQRVARRFESAQFVAIDTIVQQPNVESIAFDVRSGSYLAGALAAMLSHTGHVAFIGGARSSYLEPYAQGFAAGAASIDPHVQVTTRYVDSFTDEGAARSAARALARAGADVLYVAAGRAGAGAIGNGPAVIAADSDENQTPGVVASMIKDVARAAQDACDDVVAEKPVSGLTVLGVGNGVSVAIAPAAKLSAAQRQRFDALAQSLRVPH